MNIQVDWPGGPLNRPEGVIRKCSIEERHPRFIARKKWRYYNEIQENKDETWRTFRHMPSSGRGKSPYLYLTMLCGEMFLTFLLAAPVFGKLSRLTRKGTWRFFLVDCEIFTFGFLERSTNLTKKKHFWKIAWIAWDMAIQRCAFACTKYSSRSLQLSGTQTWWCWMTLGPFSHALTQIMPLSSPANVLPKKKWPNNSFLGRMVRL